MLDHHEVESILRDMRQEIISSREEVQRLRTENEQLSMARGTTAPRFTPYEPYNEEIQQILDNHHVGAQAPPEPEELVLAKELIMVIEHTTGQLATKVFIPYEPGVFPVGYTPTLEEIEEQILEAIVETMSGKTLSYVPYNGISQNRFFINTSHIIQFFPFEEEEYLKLYPKRDQFHGSSSPRLTI